jgi:hypothetical protein
MLQEYDGACRAPASGSHSDTRGRISRIGPGCAGICGASNLYVVKTIMTRITFFILCVISLELDARPVIQPHMATYEVRLTKVIGPEAPRSLSGTLVYLVRDTCDGFIQESSIDLIIEQRDGPPTRFRQNFNSFESHDQMRSTFSLRVTANDREVDRYEGDIERMADGLTMTYRHQDESNGEREEYQAPPDTLLSLAFTAFVAEQAASGERFVSRVVADGLLEDGPNRLSTVIGPQPDQAPQYPDPEGLLQGRPWPVSLAYYPSAGTSELPTQEMRISLYAGGIVSEIDQDLGDYAVLTSLIDLQSAPGCED